MSEGYDFDLVCIGSGPAGQRAAVQAAKLGKRVAVVEKRPCVGAPVWIWEPFRARRFAKPFVRSRKAIACSSQPGMSA